MARAAKECDQDMGKIWKKLAEQVKVIIVHISTEDGIAADAEQVFKYVCI